MLALDTEAQERWKREGKREKHRQERRAALDKEIRSNTISVEDDAGRDTSSLLAQMGRPLTSQEVQRRLHLCNPSLIFVRNPRYPELTAVYIERDERTQAGTGEKKRKHVCGMESGIMPECSVLHKTKIKVGNPDILGHGDKMIPREAMKWMEVETFYAETRGWRTVLLRLMKADLITRWHVEQYFGWSPSLDSKKWHDQTEGVINAEHHRTDAASVAGAA